MTIEAWLESLGLGQYSAPFRENEIDWDVLPDLTVDDLKELGVNSVGHRRRLLTAISRLEDGEAASAQDSTDTPTLPERASSAPSRKQQVGERRHVAVLFADLAGYTQLTADIGPEAMHGVLDAFFTRVDAIIARMGGRVDKHLGDCVMGVFGAPTAHGDDPKRAILAAIEIRRAMPDITAKAGHKIDVHIGVSTGIVVASYVGAGATTEYAVTGQSVNLASRLSDVAKTGEILVSDGLKRSVEDQFEFKSAGLLDVKGFAEPIAGWHVETVSTKQQRRGIFAGRLGELEQFASVLRTVRETGAGHVVVLRSEAGLGKTRLSEELQALATDIGYASHRGVVLDFGGETGRDAVRMLIRDILRIDADVSDAVSEEQLIRLVQEGAIDPEHEIHLYDLLDIHKPDRVAAQYDAMDNARRQQGRGETISQLVSNAAALTPRLLIVEDVHWAKAPLLRALSKMAQAIRDVPALLLITTRVEGDPLDRAWRSMAAGSPFITIDLIPLRPEDAKELCAEDAIDPVMARDLIERAGGNPLFLKQLLRHARSHDTTSVPGTIQSLVQATVDNLEPGGRLAIEAASVIGQRVDPMLMRHLLDLQTFEADHLIEKNLLRPQGAEYFFVHALIRDAVYLSLLETRKHDLHEKAAAWFKDRDTRLHAEHLAMAASDGAPAAFRSAAEEEIRKYHYETALALIERGLGLTAEPAKRLRLQLLEGQTWLEFGRTAEALKSFEKARDSAVRPLDKCLALIGLASVKRMTENIDGALADLDAAQELADKEDWHAELARIHFLRGNLLFPRGDFDSCLKEHQAGLHFAHVASRPDLQAASLGGLGDAEYVRGRMASAQRHLEDCVALARQQGLGRIEVANRAQIAHTLHYTTAQEVAYEAARQAMAAAAQVGHNRAELNADAAVLKCLSAMARHEECLQEIEAYEQRVERLGAHRFGQVAGVVRAKSLGALGRIEEAQKAAKDGVALAKATGYAFHGPAMSSAAAVVASSPDRKRALMAEAEEGVAAGCVGHNQFRVYADGITVAWDLRDLAMLRHYVGKAAAYPGDETVAWSEFQALRGRALLFRLEQADAEESQAALADARQMAQSLQFLAWPIAG